MVVKLQREFWEYFQVLLQFFLEILGKEDMLVSGEERLTRSTTDLVSQLQGISAIHLL